MKVNELLSEAKADSVSVPNLDGTYKRFKSLLSPGVSEWKESRDPRKPVKVKQPTKAEIDQRILNRADDAIAYAFDGGDPADKLAPYIRKNNITMDDIDRVMKKHYKKDFYGTLAQMWDDMQGDQVSDAERGHVDANNQFYDYDKATKKVTPKDNPWK